ncbi:phosphate ABC transporter, permease protein PstA, partial [Rhodococcus sp. IEGM 1409]|nr:phosphate ABC transporter, permease protein PstA [Rhodococcus sp. IEGM 1409]
LLVGIVCAVVSPPLCIFVAISLVEYADRKSKLGNLTTVMVDILSGGPSIGDAPFIDALSIATFGSPTSA